jgi:hypothetical protein
VLGIPYANRREVEEAWSFARQKFRGRTRAI